MSNNTAKTCSHRSMMSAMSYQVWDMVDILEENKKDIIDGKGNVDRSILSLANDIIFLYHTYMQNEADFRKYIHTFNDVHDAEVIDGRGLPQSFDMVATELGKINIEINGDSFPDAPGNDSEVERDTLLLAVLNQVAYLVDIFEHSPNYRSFASMSYYTIHVYSLVAYGSHDFFDKYADRLHKVSVDADSDEKVRNFVLKKLNKIINKYSDELYTI